MINRNINAIADPNRVLPFNTKLKARIYTQTNDPIYSKSCPYPVSVAPSINNEIKTLLKDGIIKESCSPYSSYVVFKMGLDESGNPKLRLKIDYRKIKKNQFLIDTQYRILPQFQLILKMGNKLCLALTMGLENEPSIFQRSIWLVSIKS